LGIYIGNLFPQIIAAFGGNRASPLTPPCPGVPPGAPAVAGFGQKYLLIFDM